MKLTALLAPIGLLTPVALLSACQTADRDIDSTAIGEDDADADADADADWVRVDEMGNVMERSVDVAVAPDGTAFVSWVDSRDIVWVRRSDDGGATWGEAAEVNTDGSTAGVTMARRPYVATDGNRVAVTFVDLNAGVVEVYESKADSLAFGSTVTLGGEATFNDFAKALFVEGELIVVWQTYTPDGAMVLARESTAWDEEAADDGVPGLPCECCPLDALAASSGDLLIAFRNNNSNTREHWVSMLPSGDSAEISDTEGTLWECPMEGPRLGEADGAVLAVWADASMSAATWMATSVDSGRTWSGERDIFGENGTSSPSIATAAGGIVTVTTEVGGRAMMVGSVDGGATFSTPVDLSCPSGNIGYPQLDGDGGIIVAGGSAGDGTAWVSRVQ